MTKAEYLIRKAGYYYRPNGQGYTASPLEAGRYTLAQAQRVTHPNGPDGPRDGMDYLHESEVLTAKHHPRDPTVLVDTLRKIGLAAALAMPTAEDHNEAACWRMIEQACSSALAEWERSSA